MPETHTSHPDEVFNAARRLDDRAARRAYLDQACGDDVNLRRQVEALLAAYEQANSFLESPAAAPGIVDFRLGMTTDLPAQDLGEAPGTVIGSYKLLEQIGEGGFGVVFMAEQTHPVRRKVALKVIKPGMDTRQVIARFEAERQALAIMDHANIAKVLDGGATASGRPYFVMELVRGVPITQFCDENHYTPRQRLELFVSICHAVQHAHQKGIIHRDLKPSNVLVSVHDTTPVVKVIDFGIAKAMGQELTDKTLFTNFAQMIGTPLYMSPEQAGQSGLDIDTRSDIYSLGVLLYELLTGTTPFEGSRFKQVAYEEIRRIIREEEPPRPSTRLSTMGEKAQSISAQRKSDPKRLGRLVRGELDWIVMKALEKDRSRRYETANGFAADVQRYLADEPVAACPPSASYRLKKFVRRHRGGVAVAALVLPLLVLLGSGVGWAVRDRAARQGRLAAQVDVILNEVGQLERGQRWAEALAAARRAQAALASGEADAATAGRVGERLTRLQFVDQLERVRMRLATLRGWSFDYAGGDRDYGRAFRDYGVDVDALPVETSVARLRGRPELTVPLAAALDTWTYARRALKPHSTDWERLAAVARGVDPDPLRNRFRSTSGPADAQAYEDLRRLAESSDIHTQHPVTLSILAQHLWNVGLTDSAIRLLRDAQHAYPGDFWLNYGLASELAKQKDYEGAVRFYTAAASIRPDAAAAHTGLGGALVDQGKVNEGVAAYRKAVELEPSDPKLHINYGFALRKQKKLDEAIDAHRQAIRLDPTFAAAYSNLGAIFGDQKKLDAAVDALRKAVELDPRDAVAHTNLGIALFRQKTMDAAAAAYRKAIELDPGHAAAYSNFAAVLTEQRKLDESVTASRKAIELDPAFGEAYRNLGNALLGQKKPEDAIAAYRKGLEVDPTYAENYFALGVVLKDQGKVAEAVAAYRKTIEVDPGHADAYSNLGVALKRQNEPDEALAAYRRAIELDPRHAAAHTNLGVLLKEQKKLDEALVASQKAVDLDPENAVFRLNLGAILSERADDLEKAVACFRRAIELDPEFADAYSNLGSALQRQGKLDAAVTACRKAIELDAKHAGAYNKLGVALRAQKNLEEAARAFRTAIELGAKADAYTNLGVVLADQQDLDGAIAAYRTAIELEPDHGPAYYNLGAVLMRLNKLDEAVAALRMSIELDPKLAVAYGNLANALAKQGKLDEAVAAMRRMLEVDPRNALAHYNLGLFLKRQGKMDAAITHLREAVQLDPKLAVAHSGLGVAFKAQNRLDEAIAAYKTAMALNPNDAVAHSNLALLLATSAEPRLRDHAQALTLAKRAVELDPTNPDLPITLGIAHYRTGDWNAAIAALEVSLELRRGGNGFDWFFLAMAHWQSGNKEEARRWYDKAVEWMEKNAPTNEELIRFRTESAELLGVK